MRPLAIRLALSWLLWNVAGNSAEWLAVRGDAQRTGWQPDERHLTPKTVQAMRLLWKKQLSGDRLSSPMLLGPIVTYRGIKELVFVANASGHVWAVDVDLGTVFWSRELPVAASDATCRSAQPMMPIVLGSSVAALPARNLDNDEDEFSDGSRPVLVATADGMVHSLRASTGEDLVPPRRLTRGRPVLLDGFGDVLYGSGASGCDPLPRGLEAMRGNGVEARVTVAALNRESIGGMAIGLLGSIHLDVDNDRADLGDLVIAAPLRRTEPPESGEAQLSVPRRGDSAAEKQEYVDSRIAVFPWRGREVVALVTDTGQLILRSHRADGTGPSRSSSFDGRLGHERGEGWSALGGLATWEDLARERWICGIGTNGRSRRIAAFHVVEKDGRAALDLAWRSDEFASVTAPVIAGGLLYVVQSESTGKSALLKLLALDAGGGRPLVSSFMGLESKSVSENPAVADGHICFTGGDGVLYCFGLPFEI